jgi:hypothetical protein
MCTATIVHGYIFNFVGKLSLCKKDISHLCQVKMAIFACGSSTQPSPKTRWTRQACIEVKSRSNHTLRLYFRGCKAVCVPGSRRPDLTDYCLIEKPLKNFYEDISAGKITHGTLEMSSLRGTNISIIYIKMKNDKILPKLG